MKLMILGAQPLHALAPRISSYALAHCVTNSTMQRMPSAEPSPRQELLAARSNVQRQIDRLEARYYPLAPIGLVRGGVFPLILFLLGLGSVAPFQTNGVWIDNGELILGLTRTRRGIDDALDELGSEEA